MKIEISIKQLEQLLNEQKSLCRNHFDKVWRDSEMVKQMEKLDPEKKVINMMHEVRDPILGAEFPSDFLVLKKYITD